MLSQTQPFAKQF